MGDFVSDLLMRQVEDQNGVLLPARATLKFAGTDVSVADVGGETVATFGLNAGVINGAIATTDATPANIDLDVLDPDQNSLNVVGVRVIGETPTEGSKILKDFTVALSGVAHWLKVGGTGSNAPYSESDIIYHNGFGHNLSTANIVCNSVSGGLLRVTVTGVAGMTINWRAIAWKTAL